MKKLRLSFPLKRTLSLLLAVVMILGLLQPAIAGETSIPEFDFSEEVVWDNAESESIEDSANVITVSEARAVTTGQTVAVRGIVTNFYEPNIGNRNAFHLQDLSPSGSDSGILVRGPNGIAPDSLVGSEVIVVGVRNGNTSGNGFINVQNITIPNAGAIEIVTPPATAPQPIPIHIDNLLDLRSSAYSSMLISTGPIRLTGTLTGPGGRENITIEAPAGAGNYNFVLGGNYNSWHTNLPAGAQAGNVYIEITRATVHWWEARSEVQIRMIDTSTDVRLYEPGTVDKVDLLAAIHAAAPIYATGQGNYTTESWGVFTTARAHAIAVSNDAVATQTQVNEARVALLAAIEGLRTTAPTSLTVTLQSIADLHGHMNSWMSNLDPGFSRFVTFMRERSAAVEAETGHAPVVLHAGDTFFGQAHQNVFWGEPTLWALNTLNTRYGAIGNHEFSWQNRALMESFSETDPVRRAELIANVSRTPNPVWEYLPEGHPLNTVQPGIPFLAADIVYAEGHPREGQHPDWLKPYAILDDWYEEYGVRIALIGLSHPQMESMSGAMDRQYLRFRTPGMTGTGMENFEWLEEMINMLRNPDGPYGVNAVVALTHVSSGNIMNNIVDTLLQRGYGWFDGFFPGHTHTTSTGVRTYGFGPDQRRTAHALAPHHGRAHGQIQLVFEEGVLQPVAAGTIHTQVHGSNANHIRAMTPDADMFRLVHGAGATWTRTGTNQNTNLTITYPVGMNPGDGFTVHDDLTILLNTPIEARGDWGWEQLVAYVWGPARSDRIVWSRTQSTADHYLVHMLYEFIAENHADDLPSTPGVDKWGGTVIVNNVSSWRGGRISSFDPDDVVNELSLRGALTFENVMPLFEIRGRNLIEILNMPPGGDPPTPPGWGRGADTHPNWGTMQGQTLAGVFFHDGQWHITSTGLPISEDGIYRKGASNHLFNSYNESGGQRWPLPGNLQGNVLGFEVIDFVGDGNASSMLFQKGPRFIVRDENNNALTIQETWLRQAQRRAEQTPADLASWIEVQANGPGTAMMYVWGNGTGGTQRNPDASSHTSWGLPAYPGSNLRDFVINRVAVRVIASQTAQQIADGYEFLGWFDGNDLVSEDLVYIFPAANDVTLVAVFGQSGTDPDFIDVTFDARGGYPGYQTVSAMVGTTYGSLFHHITEPTRDGYVFLGWFTAYTGGTPVLANTPITELLGHSVYAQWVAFSGPRPNDTFEFQILHTNDLHGHFANRQYTQNRYFTGLATLYNRIQSERETIREGTYTWADRTLLIDLGDTIQGNLSAPLHSVIWDEHPGNVAQMDPIVYGMELLDFDVFILGNHEFDYGVYRLYRALGWNPETGTPFTGAQARESGHYFSGAILAGNVVHANSIDPETGVGTSAFDAYYIHCFVDQGGPRFAIIGMLPQTTVGYNAVWFNEANIDTTAASVQTAATIAWLESDAAYEYYGNIDFYIGAQHMGQAAARDVLGTAVPGHDGRIVADYMVAFMGGHAHQAVEGSFGTGPAGTVMYQEAGNRGNRLGRMRFEAIFCATDGWTIDRRAKPIGGVQGNLVGGALTVANSPANEAFMTRSMISHADALLRQLAQEPIGTITGPAWTPTLNGGNQFMEDTALQRAVQESFLYFANTGIRHSTDPVFTALRERGAEVTVAMVGPLGNGTRNFNTGADSDGNIRIFDAYGIYEFDNNTQVILELTGHQLKLWLEHGYANLPIHLPTTNLFPNITGNNSWRIQHGAGMRHTIDLTRPAWERITLLNGDGTPFDLDTVIFVTANNHTTGQRSFIAGPGSGAQELELRRRMLELPAAQTINGLGGEAGMPVIHLENAHFVLFVENPANGSVVEVVQNPFGATGLLIEYIRSVLRDDINDLDSIGNFDNATEAFNESDPTFTFILPVMDEVVLEMATRIVNANIGVNATGTAAGSRPNMGNIRARLNPEVQSLWDLYVANMDRVECATYIPGSWPAFVSALEMAGEVILASGLQGSPIAGPFEETLTALQEAINGLRQQRSSVTITLQAIADYHGFLTSEQSVADPGAPRFVTFMDQRADSVRASTGYDPVVLAAGDTFFGQSINNLMWGEPALEVLNRLNVRYNAVGNHEFSWHNRYLMESFAITDADERAVFLDERVIRNANPVWNALPEGHLLNTVQPGITHLAADIIYQTGHPNEGEHPWWIQPYAILDDWYDDYGVTVALIGLSHPNMTSMTQQMDRRYLEFRTPRVIGATGVSGGFSQGGVEVHFEWLEDMINMLRDPDGDYGVNAVVVLSHVSSGFLSNDIAQRLLIRGDAHLDGFFAGHTHGTTNVRVTHANTPGVTTPVVLGQQHGRGHGQIQLEFVDGELVANPSGFFNQVVPGQNATHVRAMDPDPEVFRWVHGANATWTRVGSNQNSNLNIDVSSPGLSLDLPMEERGDWGWQQLRDYWWGEVLGTRQTYSRTAHHRNQHLINLAVDYIDRVHANDLSYITGEPFAGTIITFANSGWRAQGSDRYTWGPNTSVSSNDLRDALTFEREIVLFEMRGVDVVEMLNFVGGGDPTGGIYGRNAPNELWPRGVPNWGVMGQGQTNSGAFLHDGVWHLTTTLAPITPDGVYRLGMAHNLFNGFRAEGSQRWPAPGNMQGHALGWEVIDFVSGDSQPNVNFAGVDDYGDLGPRHTSRHETTGIPVNFWDIWELEMAHRGRIVEAGGRVASWVQVGATSGGSAALAVWGLAGAQSTWGAPAYPGGGNTSDLIIHGAAVRATASQTDAQIANGYVFLGWFDADGAPDAAPLSTDLVYIFHAPPEDLTLEARFAEEISTPVVDAIALIDAASPVDIAVSRAAETDEARMAAVILTKLNALPGMAELDVTLRLSLVDGRWVVTVEHGAISDNTNVEVRIAFTGTNPNELRSILAENDVLLKTAGNLGIFSHHSPFVIPEGGTLTVVTTLNVQGNAELIIEGRLVVQENGRVNNQGGAGGTIVIAGSGELVNYGHVENVTNSTVVNYGTIVNNGRFEVRAGTRLHNCGKVEGSLNIHRNAIRINCLSCE